MHYRAISNRGSHFKGFQYKKMVHSFYSKAKGWIDSVHALFNLCPKIKKLLNQTWQFSFVISV